MKVVHFSTGVSNGTAAYTLSKKLNDHGVNSKVVCLNSNINTNEVILMDNFFTRIRYKTYYYSEQMIFKLLNPKNKIHHSLGFSFISKNKILEHIEENDIIHLHWVLGGFFDLKLIEKIASTNTVILTHHDAWFSCGTEHHNSKNINIEELILTSRINSFIFNNKIKNENIYNKCNHIFPSKWLSNDFNSRVVVDKCKKIINCVSSDVFYATEINVVEKIRLSFGAVNIVSNVMKGTVYVNKLLWLVNESEYLYSQVEIVIFGINKLNETESFFYEQYPNIHFELHGFIHSKQELSNIYSGCDIFFNLSKIENLSTVMLEASLSGCIIVAFDVGGNREASTESAVLIKPYSIIELKLSFAKLVEKIIRLLPCERFTLRNEIKEESKGKFDDEKTIASHVEFYNKAVRRNSLV